MPGLPKGQVRNLIRVPENYNKRVTIDGMRVRFRPTIEVTVYKDRWGRYAVVDKGRRLTPEEKKLGLKRVRSKEAQWIASQYETIGPNAKLRKLESNKRRPENRNFRAWKVGAVEGWVQLKTGSFIGKDMPGRQGEMEVLMYSLDRTTFAANNHISFSDIWDKMTIQQRFDAMTRLQQIDWETFFKEYIDSDGNYDDDLNLERQEEGLAMVMEILKG